jgi:hypothetical protein
VTTSPIYLAAAHHTVLPPRTLSRRPRQRYVEYQADLHAAAGLDLDLDSLTRGDQYTSVELADALLGETGPAPLSGLDVRIELR